MLGTTLADKRYGCGLESRYRLVAGKSRIASEQETPLEETCTSEELKREFQALCIRFTAWAQQELEHRASRDARLSDLPFVHSEFRIGQRALAENTFKAKKRGRCLMVQADTGIGKTVGTLFPALKAMPVEKLDKVFFLSTAPG